MTAQYEIDFSAPVLTGEELRDRGIDQALRSADLADPSWSEAAYSFLVAYSRSGHSFLAEDVREAAKGKLPDPPSLRAWGGIVRRAAMSGEIQRCGFRNVSNAKAHCTPATLWRRAI